MPAARSLPPLLPAPRSVQRRAGSFVMRDGTPIVLAPGADSVDFETARALSDEVRRTSGVALPIESHRAGEAPGPHVVLRRTDTLRTPGEEAYRLSVTPHRIEILARSSAGLRWGVETLRQLVDVRGRVPACTVDDAPSLSLRGIMLDVSRGKVPRPDTLREIIDLCARTKLNVLMLYTEHTFRFRRHPKIGAQDSPLDAETMRELDAYAAARCVDLIPCLQSLGHMSHVLEHDEYKHLDETDEGWTCLPRNPAPTSCFETCTTSTSRTSVRDG